MERKTIWNECLIDRNKVERANFSDKDGFFTFWFYSMNLCHFEVSVYEKKAEKLFISTNKKDIENRSRVGLENRRKADGKEMGRPDTIVVED